MQNTSAETDAAQAVSPSAANGVEVYAVYGVEPEVQAYAMAKYSRSALSMKESLREINQQKAEKFLNTFYFQYGHRSIADLAHIAMAIERLSLLAAIEIADEQRWDGQERSTRYQDFKKSGFYTPDFGGDEAALTLYRDTVTNLFIHYQELSAKTFEYLAEITPRPEDMKQDAYERTLRARAFDISRYLLPLATNTSLGQIVNARTLETQVARLLSHAHAEIRALGAALKRAATTPAYNVNRESLAHLAERIRERCPDLAEEADRELLRDVQVAPTLVKYADPSAYQQATRKELTQAASELMRETAVVDAPAVDLLDDEALEVELATSLLYEHCHYPYRQIRNTVASLSSARQLEIIDLGLRNRGAHDEMKRSFCAGQQFRFDILMDLGGFRDMHRHRRCVQLGQGFTTQHGFAAPEELAAAGLLEEYQRSMAAAADAISKLEKGSAPEAQQNSQYAIPLAFLKRTLFKMDFAEVVYISELRTTPAGHASYRKVAYEMYEAVASRHPGLAHYFRVHDVRQPVDLLKR
ncbi:MAG: FAD-dependent thymidylate synthase [Acidobacteriales bacterium]|nr:FAD-dependent thymidylate synthase [Terriglobales bacterium]